MLYKVSQMGVSRAWEAGEHSPRQVFVGMIPSVPYKYHQLEATICHTDRSLANAASHVQNKEVNLLCFWFDALFYAHRVPQFILP